MRMGHVRRFPRVSVLMSVYNGGEEVRGAIDSILHQTFEDFEFVIVNDGSTDDTEEVLRSYNDRRIVLRSNKRNIGLTRSLNVGLEVAKGEFIARQDADDLSIAYRLAHQVDFLDSQDSVAVVGSAYYEFRTSLGERHLRTLPTDSHSILNTLLYQHALCHGSVLMRSACLRYVGGYDPAFPLAQDRDLWLRLGEHYKLANVHEPLYYLRVSDGSVTGRSRSQQRTLAQTSVRAALGRGILTPCSLALGRFYWLEALEALNGTGDNAAGVSLEMAFEANPDLDADASYLVGRSLEYAVEYLRFDKLADIDAGHRLEGIRFLLRLFEILPVGLTRIQSQRSRVVAEYYASLAFQEFHARDSQRTMKCVKSALREDATQWRNFGLLSIFMRSVIGRWK